MKLHLSAQLKTYLLAAMMISSQSAFSAELTYDAGVENGGVLASAADGDTVIIDLQGTEGVKSGDWFGLNFTVAEGVTIKVRSWAITNGYGSKTYTFNSSIEDDNTADPADILFYGWDNKDNEITYNFNGDMSDFTGDIRTGSQSGLALNFGGGSRYDVSGQGAIDIWTSNHAKALTYNVTDEEGAGIYSTITNSSIHAVTIAFEGGANAFYDVSSVITTNALNIAENTTADFNAAVIATTALADGTAASVNLGASSRANFYAALTANTMTLGANAAVGFAASATLANLSAQTGSSITIEAGETVTISDSITGAITTSGEGTLTLDGTWVFTEVMQNDANLYLGESFVLDLSGQSFNLNGEKYELTILSGTGSDNFNTWLSAGELSTKLLGTSTIGREFSYEGGVLSYQLTGTSYTHDGGSLVWTVGQDFSGDGAYVDGSQVTFNGVTQATLGSDVAAVNMTLNDAASLIIGSSDYSITVDSISLGAGAALVAHGELDYSNVTLVAGAYLALYYGNDGTELDLSKISAAAGSDFTVRYSSENVTVTNDGSFAGNLTLRTSAYTMSQTALAPLESLYLSDGASMTISDAYAGEALLTKVGTEGGKFLNLALQSLVNDSGTDVKLSDHFYGSLVVRSGQISALGSDLGNAQELVMKNGTGIIFDESSSVDTPITFAANVTLEDSATVTVRSWGGSATRALTGAITGAASTTLKQTDGGTVRLDNLDNFTGSLSVEGGKFIVNDDAVLNTVAISSGKTLEIAAAKTVSTTGDDGSGYYTRYSSHSYNIELGDGAKFTDNVILGLSGGSSDANTTLNITTTEGSTAHYTVDGFFGADSANSQTYVNIGAGVIMESLATHTASDGKSGSLAGGPVFMLGHYSGSATSELSISGTLILNSGFSNHDATSNVYVEEGGTLEMRKGLFAKNNSGIITIDVKDKGTLKLHNQLSTDDSYDMNVNLAAGSKLVATGSYVNVRNNLALVGDTGAATVSLDTAGGILNISSVIRNATENGTALHVDVEAGQTVVLSGENIHSGGTSIMGGGVLNLANNSAAGTGDINLSEGSTLVIGNNVTIDNTLNVDGTGNTLRAIAFGRSSTSQFTGSIVGTDKTEDSLTLSSSISSLAAASVTKVTLNADRDLTIGDSTFTEAAIVVKDNATLTLQNVTLDATTSVDVAAGATLTMNNVRNTGITASAPTMVDVTTLEGTFEPMDVYTLTGVNVGVSGKDSLTLEFDIASFDVTTLTGMVGFELAGVADYAALGVYYNNVNLVINGVSVAALGYFESAGSDLILYVPEPSTATLSLLALAGLLARRRRKTA